MSRLTDEQVQGLRDGISLTKRLEIKAGMLRMGERVAFGSDSSIMLQAADTIHALATEVIESRAEIAKMRKELRVWEDAFATGRLGLAALRALHGRDET
jgi:hypothetical protein